MRLKVDYEWESLREVVVGYPRIRLGTGIPRYVKNFMPPSALAMAEEILKGIVLEQERDGGVHDAH